MCIKDAKANLVRLGILLLLRRYSTTCTRWAKFSSFLFYFCISPPSYYLVTFFTCLDLLIVFCSTRFQLLEMSLWKCTMSSSPWRLIVPPSNLRNRWRRQWSKSRRTTTLLFASTFLCVILPLAQIFSSKSKFIMTWIQNQRCSQRSRRC